MNGNNTNYIKIKNKKGRKIKCLRQYVIIILIYEISLMANKFSRQIRFEKNVILMSFVLDAEKYIK